MENNKIISKEIGHALVRDHLIKYNLHETLATFDNENRNSITVFEQDLLPLVMVDPSITKPSEENRNKNNNISLVIQALYTNQTLTNKLKKYKTHVKWQQNKLEDSHMYLTDMTKKYEKSINQCMKLQEELKQKQKEQNNNSNTMPSPSAYQNNDQNATERMLQLERENIQRKTQLKQMIEIQKQQQFKNEEAMDAANGQIKTLQRTLQEQSKEIMASKDIQNELNEKIESNEEDIHLKQREIQELKEELKVKNRSYKQLSSRLESIEQYKETNHELEKKIVELQVNVSGLQNEIQSKDDHLNMLKKEKRVMIKQMDKREDEIVEKKKQLDEQMQTINELQMNINEYMQACTNLEKKVKASKKQSSNTQQKYQTTNEKMEKLQKQIQPMQEKLKEFQLENHNLKKRIILMEQQSKLMKKHFEKTQKVNTQYHKEKYKQAIKQQESLIKDLDIQNHQIKRETRMMEKQTPNRISSPETPAQHELSEISQHLHALKSAIVNYSPQTPTGQRYSPTSTPSNHVSFQMTPQRESPNKDIQDDLDSNIRSLINICETLKRTEQEL